VKNPETKRIDQRTKGISMTDDDSTTPNDHVVADGAADPLADVIKHDEEDDMHAGAGVLGDDKDTDAATSVLIAEAAAAAMEAAVADVDITAAALAAQDAAAEEHDHHQQDAVAAVAAAEEAAAAVAAATAKKNEQRRKRYREKVVEEHESKMAGKKAKALDNSHSHEESLAARRSKDRMRYANMTGDQRQQYNSKRRDQYHRQSEISRQKRRERERARYHSFTTDDAKGRNARRAKLERERYQKLTADELESKNRKRRERAAHARQKKDGDKVGGSSSSGCACEWQLWHLYMFSPFGNTCFSRCSPFLRLEVWRATSMTTTRWMRRSRTKSIRMNFPWSLPMPLGKTVTWRPSSKWIRGKNDMAQVYSFVYWWNVCFAGICQAFYFTPFL
jgi:hypothetical protein